jgi:hypothetical protein
LQLLKRIEAEQGDLSKYHERQAKAAAQKADLEAQLIDNQVKIQLITDLHWIKSPFNAGFIRLVGLI